MSLRYETTASHIYDALKQLPRTGWVIRNVPDPETVYDHTVSLIKLAEEMTDELALSDEELDDLTHMLEVHDWAEAVAGDEFIPNEDRLSYEERKIEKSKRERAGLAELLEGKAYREVVSELWERYEASSDKIAKLAKELDKFQALALSAEYERRYNIPLFEEFDQYYIRENSFKNPFILGKIKELRDSFKRD